MSALETTKTHNDFLEWSENARRFFMDTLGSTSTSRVNAQIAYVAESIARDDKATLVCDYHVKRAIRRELQELFDNQHK